jgi:hypothetical protein
LQPLGSKWRSGRQRQVFALPYSSECILLPVSQAEQPSFKQVADQGLGQFRIKPPP